MIVRQFGLIRLMLLIGLGTVAGAVCPHGAGAQVPVRRDTVSGRRDTVRSRADSVLRRVPPTVGSDTIRVPVPPRADSTIRNDSINKGIVPLPAAAVKKDTIKPPLARAEAPPILEIGAPRIFDRAAIYATGALTLGDFIARVPGISEFSTGFLEAPAVYASLGNLRRIRLFLDGIELDPQDLRARGVAPVNDLPLHALEEIRLERTADELRVYARSWRVDRTIPYTRADIYTGDLNTNLYRAYFGRRFDHGEALQVAAEQFTTQPDRALPSSDGTNIMARLGITHGPWSLDGFMERVHRNRAPWVGTGDAAETRDTVPGLEMFRTTAYARGGYGDPDRGRWVQLIASLNNYELHARSSTSLELALPSAIDSLTAAVDSVSYQNQYLLTGGITRGVSAISAAERIRVGGGRTSHVMSGRASTAVGPLAVSLFAQGRSDLDPARADATVKFSPLNRVALLGSASRTGDGFFDRMFTEPHNGVYLDAEGVFQPGAARVLTANDTLEVIRYQMLASNNLRAELGVRIRDLWVSGGIIRRGAVTLLLAPSEFDSIYAKARSTRQEGEATAKTLTVRGRLWKSLYADAWGVAWNDTAGFYRPQYQTRGELYIQTNLLDKFPRGNFGLLTSLAHEYRSNSIFPFGGDTVRVAPGYRMLTFKIEIRVQSAVVSYQFRNLLQAQYQQVPGFNFPRQTQFYGLRWEFWN